MKRKSIAVISEVGSSSRAPSGGILRSIRSLMEYSKHFDTYLLLTPMQSIDPEMLEYLYRETGVKRVVKLKSWYLFRKTIDNPQLGLNFMYALIPRVILDLSLVGLDKIETGLHGVIVLNEPLHFLRIGQIVKEKLNIPSIVLLQLPLFYSDRARRDKILEAYSLWYKELHSGERVRKVYRELRTQAEFLVMHSRLAKKLLSSYDALIAVSRSIPLEMGKCFTSKFYVLDPGVSLTNEDMKMIERIKKTIGSSKENYVVLGDA